MDVIIIGAGGHGKVVLDILRSAGTFNPVGFVDANPNLAGTTISGLPVIGQINSLPKIRAQKIKGAIIAIGDNRTRNSYAKIVRDSGFELINAIHPSAIVSSTAKLGVNIAIAAGAMVSAEVRIGDSVILNTGSVVDHECEIGNAVHICPGALLAGRVRVGDEAFIGLGAKIIQCLSIGSGATIGAGAVVLNDVVGGATAVGVPARVVKMMVRAAQA
jgi:sugar O-acyltransferase (sialic acid O-acetyltransferase NeuD family)